MCVEKYNLAQYSSAGAPRNPSVPQNISWGSVRVPRFLRGNDFLLQYVDASF